MYKAYKVAIIQHAPVFLNIDESLKKAAGCLSAGSKCLAPIGGFVYYPGEKLKAERWEAGRRGGWEARRL